MSIENDQLQRQIPKFCSCIYNKGTSFKRTQTPKKWLKWSVQRPVLNIIKRTLKKRLLPLKMKSRFVQVSWKFLIPTETRSKETTLFAYYKLAFPQNQHQQRAYE